MSYGNRTTGAFSGGPAQPGDEGAVAVDDVIARRAQDAVLDDAPRAVHNGVSVSPSACRHSSPGWGETLLERPGFVRALPLYRHRSQDAPSYTALLRQDGGEGLSNDDASRHKQKP